MTLNGGIGSTALGGSIVIGGVSLSGVVIAISLEIDTGTDSVRISFFKEARHSLAISSRHLSTSLNKEAASYFLNGRDPT